MTYYKSPLLIPTHLCTQQTWREISSIQRPLSIKKSNSQTSHVNAAAAAAAVTEYEPQSQGQGGNIEISYPFVLEKITFESFT
jgi:hypothetical protein